MVGLLDKLPELASSLYLLFPRIHRKPKEKELSNNYFLKSLEVLCIINQLLLHSTYTLPSAIAQTQGRELL